MTKKTKKIITRTLQKQLESHFFKNKIIILYGPRQVGKTTLCQQILKQHNTQEGYFNCETIQVRQALEKFNGNKTKTAKFLGLSRIQLYRRYKV